MYVESNTIYCKTIEDSSLKQEFIISQTFKFYKFSQKLVFYHSINVNYVY